MKDIPKPLLAVGGILALAFVAGSFGGATEESVVDTNEPYIRDETGVEGVTAKELQEAELRLAEKRAAVEQEERENDPLVSEEAKATEENVAPVAQQKSACHPSYSGCLDADALDYDCAGGSGNGPKYTGPVRVLGPDVFGLDGDNNGLACEK